MPPDDSTVPFMRIPWTASLLSQPDTVVRVPGSRHYKASTEDSLFAEILKTTRTIQSCVSFYQKPPSDEDKISEVSTLLLIGDGVNGHPRIMHGGIVAAVIDESMGILQNANHERDHIIAVSKGLAHGETPAESYGSYTAYLNITYRRPVKTPGLLIVTARYVKKEGRKEWISAEVKQEVDNGAEVICAKGEALFIESKARDNKL